ncbi:hypothetical protein PORY_001921 [Pneumocystis oryctolagi]|uniref:Uncharacterized protein n=1 Tax=Pneumocystis oryctolagi TaxID=42067 RepID=A0ACB7CAE2_9ASCO|nr:hypothetical protein PORY_001921 [Pneumocystis oryctolagi]
MYTKKLNQIKARLDISYLTDDLFMLSTVVLAFIGWITIIISSIVASFRAIYFPYYSWWIVVYQFFVIFCIISVVLSNSGDTYRIALVGCLSIVMSCELVICNALLYNSEASQPIIVSGYIFLSIINVIWILYFGSTNDSIFHSWTNSYISSKSCKDIQKQFVSGSILNKNAIVGNRDLNMSYSNDNQVSTYISHQPLSSLNTENNIIVSSEYPHKAKAIYSYNASPDDPREISFMKEEILEIGDISGKWWQARKKDGTIGIVPSNYLQLLTDG